MLKTYRAVSKISLKSILANKSSVVILLLQALVPSIVMFYLWSLILNHGQTVGGFTKNQIVIYYIGVNFINSFVWYAIDWELNDDIHSGELSNIIHRPIAIEKYYFAKMVGDRFANLLLLAPILIIGILYILVKNLLQISPIVLLKNTGIEIAWAVIFYVIVQIVNRKGLQRYSDVMG